MASDAEQLQRNPPALTFSVVVISSKGLLAGVGSPQFQSHAHTNPRFGPALGALRFEFFGQSALEQIKIHRLLKEAHRAEILAIFLGLVTAFAGDHKNSNPRGVTQRTQTLAKIETRKLRQPNREAPRRLVFQRHSQRLVGISRIQHLVGAFQVGYAAVRAWLRRHPRSRSSTYRPFGPALALGPLNSVAPPPVAEADFSPPSNAREVCTPRHPGKGFCRNKLPESNPVRAHVRRVARHVNYFDFRPQLDKLISQHPAADAGHHYVGEQ